MQGLVVRESIRRPVPDVARRVAVSSQRSGVAGSRGTATASGPCRILASITYTQANSSARYIRPNIVIRLIVIPKYDISSRVPRKENGIPSAVKVATRQFRAMNSRHA